MTRRLIVACGAGLCIVAAAGPASAQAVPPGLPDPQPALVFPLEFPGGVVWERLLPAPLAVRPVFDERHAYAALRDGTVVAVSLATGAVRWSAHQTSSVPLTAAAGLVFGTDGLAMWALAAADGSVRWRVPLSSPAVREPAVSATLIVVAGESGDLTAFATSDGASRWSVSLPATPSAPPAVQAERILAGLGDGRVVCLAASDGRTLWSHALGGAIQAVSLIGDRVYAGSSDNFLYALDSRNGNERWRWRTGGDVTEPAVADDRLVYFVAMDNVVRALRRNSGNLAWQYGLGSRPAGPPLLVEDRIIAAGIAPEIRAFDPEKGTMTGRYVVEGRLNHAPHFVPGDDDTPARLVVVTGTGTVLALGGSMERPVGAPVSVPGLLRPSRLLVLAPDIRPVDGSVEVATSRMDTPPGHLAPPDPAVPTATTASLPDLVPLYAVPGRPRAPRLIGSPILSLDGAVEPPIGIIDFLPGKAVGLETQPAYAPDGTLPGRHGL